MQGADDGKIAAAIIGVNLAKRGFQLHFSTTTGHMTWRKKMPRHKFRRLIAGHPPCLIAFEACGRANDWARKMATPGDVAENDAAEAEAIVIAPCRPEMRFAGPETENHPARPIRLCGRERLVQQRTEPVSSD